MQRILIISDNPKGTADLQQELICAGYPVLTCAGDRAGVVQAVNPRPPDVLVLDLSMPEMGGLELCERVLGTRPNVPVVVITGQGSLESAIGAMRVGAYDFITKPVDVKATVPVCDGLVVRLGRKILRVRVV
jgi:two-component system response regulator HydG